jgi:hypothetical protein
VTVPADEQRRRSPLASRRFWAITGVFALVGPLAGCLALVIFAVFACFFLPADCSGVSARPGETALYFFLYAYRFSFLFALVAGAVTALVAHRFGGIPLWFELALVPAVIVALGYPLQYLNLRDLSPLSTLAFSNPPYFVVSLVTATMIALVSRRVVLSLYGRPHAEQG